MLDNILDNDPAVARYRTAAAGLIALLVAWAENRFGFGVVGPVAEFIGLSVSTTTLGLAWVVGNVLYVAAQRWPVVDKALHLGAAKAPTYGETV